MDRKLLKSRSDLVISGMGVIILAVVIDQTQRNLQAKMALQARNEMK